jgi:hypothetical protein
MTSEPTKRPSVKPVIERITLVGEEMAANPNCKRSKWGWIGRNLPQSVPDHGWGWTRV